MRSQRQHHRDHSRAKAASACEYCGRALKADERLSVVVPDSGYLHPLDPVKDGRRKSLACSREHAQAMIEAGERAWVDEQLWAAKLRRVSATWNRSERTLDGMAELAGLTARQLRRALTWRMDGSLTGPGPESREGDT